MIRRLAYLAIFFAPFASSASGLLDLDLFRPACPCAEQIETDEAPPQSRMDMQSVAQPSRTQPTAIAESIAANEALRAGGDRYGQK